MAKKQSVVNVSALDNDPKIVVMSTEQEESFKETVKLLKEKVSNDLIEENKKEVAISKLVALGLTEDDIRAVIS